MSVIENHLETVFVSVLRRGSLDKMAAWIAENTTHSGLPYSFKDHEFQESIVCDTSREVNVRKCSQVGVSEASARLALGMVSVIQPSTGIYTLPTAKFSGTFMKTRVEPVIKGSKLLSEKLQSANDNSEVKQIGDSFLYLRGAASSNAPISIPADFLIHDEVDFCDQEVLGQYPSRLNHSSWKLIRRFSTPTVPGYGIDKAFQESRRYFNFCKCHHCGHQFVPDYYKHVRIPDYTGDLRDLTKAKLAKVRWEEAAVHCPSCGGKPSLQPEHREFVCENPTEQLVAAGYQVTPFDAPNIIRPDELVLARTRYEREQDFVNFSLGLPMEDREAALTREDMLAIMLRAEPSRSRIRVMGVDVGSVYHIVVGEVDPARDELVFVHTEQVPMGQVRTRYQQLRSEWLPACTVIDSLPHSETVMMLQGLDPTLYASVYTRTKGVLTHTVIDRDADEKQAKEFVRQVNVNRDRAFDAYMTQVREQRIRILESDQREVLIAHHTSMRRVRQYNEITQEIAYTWQKTDGIDHFHHAGLYCWVAAKIKGISGYSFYLPMFGRK